MHLRYLVIFAVVLAFSIAYADNSKMNLAETTDNPCDVNILTIFRRPTVLKSACTVPFGKFTYEDGVEYLDRKTGGNQTIFPQAKFRIGLPWRSEIALLVPNYNIITPTHIEGWSQPGIAVKHTLGYSGPWIAGVRAVYYPASDDRNFGAAKDGYTFNGTLSYHQSEFNVAVMLGESHFSTSIAEGGKEYNAFSPDIVVGWQATQWMQPYAEVYGQNHTGPDQGSGYNMDAGLLFLIRRYFEVDVEIGKNLNGQLGNFNTYYGTGLSFLF